MSRSPEKRLREQRTAGQRRRAGADGFTLIEVIVAMAIFMVVATAAAPVMLAGLRGAATARDISQTKGVAQGQLEKMRDLPFYVGREAGDFLDVLDTYYRCGPSSFASTPCQNNTPSATPSCSSTTLTALPPQTGWNGYVANTAAHCVWEPAGPLYRVVVNPVVAPGLGAFAMVISTQFLSGGDSPTPLTPSATYTSQAEGKDAPPSAQIGVTVAVFYKTAAGVRYSSTYSQIERGNPIAPLITSEAKATTVRVASALDASTNLLQQLGVINLTGELYTGSRVVTTALAATAGDSDGNQVNGARLNLVAPLDRTATSVDAAKMDYPSTGCTNQCFGKTRVDQASALASNGLPRAGTASNPVRAMVLQNPDNNGFRFANGTPDPALKLKSGPMVSLDTASSSTDTMAPVSGCALQTTGSTASYLTGTGFLDATAGTVTACGTAQANTIRLLPTDFAPDGLVRVVLNSATASCSVAKPTGGAASAASKATLTYWNGSAYVPTLTLSSTNTTDPLAGVPLTTPVNADGTKTLGDYIGSWRSATTADVRTSATATTAEASIASAVTITTTPTRAGAPSSIISVDLGAVSCQAGDRR